MEVSQKRGMIPKFYFIIFLYFVIFDTFAVMDRLLRITNKCTAR